MTGFVQMGNFFKAKPTILTTHDGDEVLKLTIGHCVVGTTGGRLYALYAIREYHHMKGKIHKVRHRSARYAVRDGDRASH